MSSNAKPRKRYRPRPVTLDTMKLAMRRACKVPAEEIAEVMQPITASFDAMRQGVGSEDDWTILAGTLELALAIEQQGVVRGLHGHLQAAHDALQGIYRRAMEEAAWHATPMYLQEIEAIDTFVWLHKTQLENLSEGEWRKAHDHAVATVRSAHGRVADIRQLKPSTQLDLIGAQA